MRFGDREEEARESLPQGFLVDVEARAGWSRAWAAASSARRDGRVGRALEVRRGA
jgi:hypothetical protein